jgi:ribonuclease Z
MYMYGVQCIDEVMANVRVIFITHIHNDHNLGLFKILSERKRVFERNKSLKKTPVFLIIPRNMMSIMSAYEDVVESLDCLIITTQDIRDFFENKQKIDTRMQKFNISDI